MLQNKYYLLVTVYCMLQYQHTIYDKSFESTVLDYLGPVMVNPFVLPKVEMATPIVKIHAAEPKNLYPKV